MTVRQVLLLLLLTFSATLAYSQSVQDSVTIINYAAPSEYKIGGITVSGTKYLDPDILITLSGLKVGDRLTIPGDDIARSVKKLWQQSLFTNVEIFITQIVGNTVFLEIQLKERPRLARFSLKGVKKGESEDLRDKINLVKGRVVNENLKINTIRTVKNFYRDKGFLNAQVTIREIPDSVLINSVLLEIEIDKGKKIKIGRIYFRGNDFASSGRLRGLMKSTKEKPRFHFSEVFAKENLRAAQERTKAATGHGLLSNLAPSGLYRYLSDHAQINIFVASKFTKSDYKTDKTALIDWYNTKGFKDARIASDTVYMKDNELFIDITVSEGKQYYFRNITWTGNTKYPDSRLNEILDIKKGTVYNQDLLDERLFMSPSGNDVSSLYMDDGYLFFQVTPVEVAVEGDSVDLEIRIYEGPQATINEVRIYGNTKTNEKVIRRELRTLPGTKFSRSDLIRSQREIANLGYFDPEQMDVKPIPDPEKGTVDIEYHLVEKPSDQLEMSAGWGGQGRGVVGSLGVSFTNFSIQNTFRKGTWSPLPSGDGQSLSLRVQSNGKVYQSYNLAFVEPWLGGKKPTQFSISYFHNRYADLDSERKVEGLLVSNNATVGIGTRLKWPDDYFTFNTYLSYQNYILNNWNSADFRITDGYSNNLGVRFVLARSSIDRLIFPMRGSNISLSLKVTPPYSAFSDKDYATVSDSEKFKWVEYHKWRFNAEWFTPVAGKLTFRAAAKYGFLGFYNKDIGYSPFERFEFGGDGLSGYSFIGRDIISLRGYQVLSPSNGASFFDKYTMELRYPLSLNPSSTMWVLGFVEGGNFWNDIKDYDPFNLRRAAGVGFRIHLPMFSLIGFDYGIGFDKNLPKTNSIGEFLGSYGKFSIILTVEPE